MAHFYASTELNVFDPAQYFSESDTEQEGQMLNYAILGGFPGTEMDNMTTNTFQKP